MRLYKMDGIWEWLRVVTTLSCPLQTWRKYDIDCSGYICAQELKVSWPPQIKWSLFTQQKQLHSQEGWPWEGEWPWPSAAPLCPMSLCRTSAPDENLSGWNERFLTPRHAAQLQLQASPLCCLYLTNHSWQSDVFGTNSDAICFSSAGFPGRLVLEAPEGGVLWEAGGVHRHHGRNSSTDRWHLPDLK